MTAARHARTILDLEPAIERLNVPIDCLALESKSGKGTPRTEKKQS